MKIISCQAQNFGSYKQIGFGFDNTGLALVYGATGSGKSTLQDLVPWTLFGVTAKDGSVDEIRNWANAAEPTVSVVYLELNGKTITINRIRGTSQQNDLFIFDESIERGKDMADTQKLINEKLGVNADTYCTSTAFNDFSDSGLFFLAKAKDKRAIFEKITDLSFPSNIALKTAAARKEVKKQLDEATNSLARYLSRYEQAKEVLASTKRYHDTWRANHANQIQKLEVQYKHFEKEKTSNIAALETKSYRFDSDKEKKINDLVDKLDSLGQRFDASKSIKEERLAKAMAALPKHCDKCGRANNTSDAIEKLKLDIEKSNLTDRQFSEYSTKLRDVQSQINPYKDQWNSAKKQKNHYGEQLDAKAKEINPFDEQLAKAEEILPKALADSEDKKQVYVALKKRHSALDQLHDLSYTLRGIMLRNVVKLIQNNTNEQLNKHFDSEFSVSFELEEDSLNVDIQKNGYPCVFKQLSKGQRQMLKLCFAVSIMKAAANNAGISFNLLMFDEALSGLDSNLKLKAYRLFEDLSNTHESVLVIEHDPEFQSLFNNKYKVTLVGDESHIEHE